MYIAAKFLRDKGQLNSDTVVTTIMSNFGLYKAFDNIGIKYEKTKVGDRYVYENMKENDFSLGGEQSGHIIFRRFARTGVGLITALVLMNIMIATQLPLSVLAQGVSMYPQVLKNVTVNDLLVTLLPSEIIPWFLSVSKINKDLLLAKLKKEQREEILHNLKAFKLTYEGLDDIDHAVITSGGINTKEIDPKSMESKLVPGLYFVGEVVDVDAFTGGFNMQIAFSTGALAADNLK